MEEPKSVSVAFDNEVGPETEEDENNLRLIFATLHPLCKAEKKLLENKTFGKMTRAEFVEYATYEDLYFSNFCMLWQRDA